MTTADARIRAASFPRGFGTIGRLVFGVRRPRRQVLGTTWSGEVTQVGSEVTTLAVGDQVCGMTGIRFGGHAELAVFPAKRVVPRPEEVSNEDAAGLLFGATTALHYLRDKAGLRPGQSVLVNGASGAIGTNAVQLVRLFGGRVDGVCSGRNAELVRELGADQVIDHTTTDLASVTQRYDVVLDTVGNLDATSGRRLLTPDGVLLLAVADLASTVIPRRRVKAGSAPERVADVAELLAMVAKGELRVVNSRVLPLDEIVAAHELVDSGRKVGNVVVVP